MFNLVSSEGRLTRAGQGWSGLVSVDEGINYINYGISGLPLLGVRTEKQSGLASRLTETRPVHILEGGASYHWCLSQRYNLLRKITNGLHYSDLRSCGVISEKRKV